MITANELRVGNLVYILKGCQIVITADHIKSIAEGDTAYTPIPITNKILGKCGFETDELRVWSKIELPESPNILSINASDGIGRGTIWLSNKTGSINLPSRTTLHQIQNLFFYLSNGKELIYKP